MIRCILTLLALTVLLTSSLSYATQYEIIDLGTLGGTTSYAHAINDSGQIVGYSYIDDINYHAFLYQNGMMNDLGTLGGSNSQAWAINNNGKIVGDSLNNSGNMYPFLYENGSMMNIGTLGGSEGTARSINNYNQIVGSARDNTTARDRVGSFIVTIML